LYAWRWVEGRGEVSIKIPKVEKTIDDLLTWNRQVSNILATSSQTLLDLSLVCLDFKVFNPINEKLLNSQSFTHLRAYTVGMFNDE